MNILVTGGAGYIGTHTVVELLNANHSVVVIDNLINSSKESLDRVTQITGKQIPFYKCDIRDRQELSEIFSMNKFDCCIHFAGLKAVGESVEKPLEYYDNNITGTLVLLDEMRKHGCKNIVFSSSATVYGDSNIMPVTEHCMKGKCKNPYGQTKSMLEDILNDLYMADVYNNVSDIWNIVILRYFNPVGAHKSGLIGENPNGMPNNLMPFITQVAAGDIKKIIVFGNDYETADGSGVRDYIHVVDLAKGHVNAIEAIEKKCGLEIYNLGTGTGYSVLEVIKTFEKVTGMEVPYTIGPRRAGDVAICYSDPTKAEIELGWKAKYSLEDMCIDSWNWQMTGFNK